MGRARASFFVTGWNTLTTLMPVERDSGSSLEAKGRPADLFEVIAIVQVE